MSTTRHLVNRQRRLAVIGSRALRGGPAAAVAPAAPAPEAEAGSVRPRRRVPSLALALALLTVLLGGFAALALGRAADLRAGASVHNRALTDTARTSELKGAVSQAVDAVFSYNYADAARSDEAARRMLVGAAVEQYATMLAEVRAQAVPQKLVLTTTVTGSGVELIDGDRARVLVYADQRSTSTAEGARSAGSTFAAAAFTVDAVRRDGVWKIAGIDTFAR
ncbi:hypothetical protein [Kitasatospora sp. NPDC057223]|uniref:hypothetical protein n=1 Tax=Kitasatospora sp. NPDC057223 TaxID=3346055 RepID=UPI00362C86BB